MGKDRAKNSKSNFSKTIKSTRSFTAIQKETAVNRVLLMNEQKSKVAREMGVPESTLRGWCKDPDKIRRLAEQSKRSMISPASTSSQPTSQNSSPSTSKYVHTPLFPLNSEFLNSGQFGSNNNNNNNNNRVETFNSETPKNKQIKTTNSSPTPNLDDSQKENNVSEPEELAQSPELSDQRPSTSSQGLPQIPESIQEILQPSLTEFFAKLSDPKYTPFFINTLRPYVMSIESNYRATRTFQSYFNCLSSEMSSSERSIFELAGLASLKTKECCLIDRDLQVMTAAAIESFSKQILNHFSYLNLQSATPNTSIHIFMALTRLMQIIHAEYP